MATTADVNGIKMSGKYNSEKAAKKASNENLTCAIVRFSDGTYDWFPVGHPVGDYANPDGNGRRFIKANNYEIVAHTQ